MRDTATRQDTHDTTPRQDTTRDGMTGQDRDAATVRDTRQDAATATGHDAGNGTATSRIWARVAAYGPYIPVPRRSTAVALYDGTIAGSSRLWRWATEDGWESLKTRGGLVGGGAVITAYSAATTPPPVNGVITASAAAAWSIWALINAPSPEEKARRGHTNPETEAPAEKLLETREDIIEWLLQVVGERNGIHFDEFHQRLSEKPNFATLERAQVPLLLDRLEIPYHRAISVDGVAGRTGVKRVDLEALLKGSPTGDPKGPRESH